MRIVRLTRARENGARERAEALELGARLGVIGDYKSEKDGSVSLLSGEAEDEIAKFGGLCTAKFAANIVTNGLDYGLLTAGDRLIVGTCELSLTRVGKPCYEACPIAQTGRICPLPENCAFAQVTHGGVIQVDDEIMHTSNENDTRENR